MCLTGPKKNLSFFKLRMCENDSNNNQGFKMFGCQAAVRSVGAVPGPFEHEVSSILIVELRQH